MDKNILKNKILLIITCVFVFSIIMITYSNAPNHVAPPSNMTQTNDKLKIENIEYVNFEDIKTRDLNIQKNSEYKYSQISVTNISTEVIYDISIDLEKEEISPTQYLIPNYYLERLEPGKTAILSAQHENNKESNLKINSYYYMDDSNEYNVSRESENEKSLSASYFPSYESLNNKPLTNDIDKISIEEIREISKDGKEYLEIDIKNISDKELNYISLTFDKIYNGNIIGNNSDAYVEKLNTNEVHTFEVNVEKDVELDLIEYRYSIYDDSENKEETAVNVKTKDKKYNLHEIQSYEELIKLQSRTRNINIAIIIIASILSVIHIKLSSNGYEKWAKYVNIFRYILFIAFIIHAVVTNI